MPGSHGRKEGRMRGGVESLVISHHAVPKKICDKVAHGDDRRHHYQPMNHWEFLNPGGGVARGGGGGGGEGRASRRGGGSCSWLL